MSSLLGIGTRQDGQGLPGGAVSESVWRVALVALAVFAAALAVRVGLLSASPEFDELYHLLAARSLADDGTFAIADGIYTRGALYTRAVAWVFGLTGQDSLEVGRWVSLVPGLLVPVGLFLWVRAVAGWLAALVVAFLVVFWPQGILESQLLRFYSSHVALFFLGAISVFGAVERRGWQRWALAGLALVFLGLAAKLQLTTAVGGLGLVLWLTAVIVLGLPVSARGRWLVAGGLAALAGLAVILAAQAGLLQKAVAILRFAPGHSEHVKDYTAFYHNALRNAYETLWPLFPVAVLLAHAKRPRLTWFCVSIFVTAFVIHSFGGMKAGRYLSYVMPFFFTVCAVAVSVLAAPAVAALRRVIPRGGVAFAVLTVCVGFAAFSNGFLIHSMKLAMGKGYISRGDWRPAAEMLGDWQDVPFRMTTHELHMLSYVGDYDLLLSYSRLTELPERADYGLDPRTGRPVVATPEGLEALLACKREGVILSEPAWWAERDETRAMEAALAEAGLMVDRRQQGEMLALHWSDPEGRAPDCASVPIPLE
jgi:hypothetical protein